MNPTNKYHLRCLFLYRRPPFLIQKVLKCVYKSTTGYTHISTSYQTNREETMV